MVSHPLEMKGGWAEKKRGEEMMSFSPVLMVSEQA